MIEFKTEHSGFRVDEQHSTLELIAKENGLWTVQESWKYPINPTEFPYFLRTGAGASHTGFDLAWLSLRQDDPRAAERLFAIATKGFPGGNGGSPER